MFISILYIFIILSSQTPWHIHITCVISAYTQIHSCFGPIVLYIYIWSNSDCHDLPILRWRSLLCFAQARHSSEPLVGFQTRLVDFPHVIPLGVCHSADMRSETLRTLYWDIHPPLNTHRIYTIPDGWLVPRLFFTIFVNTGDLDMIYLNCM